MTTQTGQAVFMLQDGAVDELMSVVLATRMTGIDLVGIGVANADCLGEPTARATQKILSLLGEQIPVGVSSARAVNAFPWEYRQYSLMVDLLPILNRTSPPPQPVGDAEQMLIDAAKACIGQGTKLMVLVLCPLTPLVRALRRDPSIKQGIGAVIWMGGALEPTPNECGPYGNVDTGLAPGANPNAEWNAFWDPSAVAETFASGLPIWMFPLNVTNQVFLDRAFILGLGAGSGANPIYDLAGQMYAMVAFQAGYSFWDTVTTAYLGQPGLFAVTKLNLSVHTQGEQQGTIFVDANGTAVTVATKVDADGFRSYLMQAWKGSVST
jgi:purine nucleosidase